MSTLTLLKIEAAPAYGTQFGLQFVFQGLEKTPVNPKGTCGTAESFMVGWEAKKIAEALRRLADNIELVASAHQL